MCGRYVLALRPSEVRRQLEASLMPVDEAPDDENGVRQSYNFAPGYHGLVYRADGPEFGRENTGKGGEKGQDGQPESNDTGKEGGDVKVEGREGENDTVSTAGHKDTRYKLQAMKWGLIPFWTKRNPDYGSMMKTINCRDDSLAEDRGMWTSMKKKKRCIVVAQGFYEWLKKNGGKEKIPHYTKRKDGQLMCFAALWDCVQYEDSDEKLYTYSIITTDSNKQLRFLHDRMPVILENGSEAIRTWLDPTRTEWSRDLQSLLKPYEGELECYPVSKDVGKVGNNSPSFIIPVNSTANKNNIANFFGAQRKSAKGETEKAAVVKTERDTQDSTTNKGIRVEHDRKEARGTADHVEGTEDNAPLPIPVAFPSAEDESKQGVKRERDDGDGEEQQQGHGEEELRDTADGAPPHQKRRITTPAVSPTKQKKANMRSATSNARSGAAKKGSPAKGDGSRKITSFFGK